MTAFSTLVVGLGQIGLGYDLQLDPGRYVHSHARAFATHPRFSLLGGVDPDASRRALLEQTYRAPAYARLADVPPEQAPDVVVVAAGTEAHARLVDEVLDRFRPRAILCEKPLAYDPSQAQAMVNRCARAGVQLFVNYMRRADPGVIEVGRRLRAGEIARPLKGVVWYTKGFLHNASHFVDLLSAWLGDISGGVVVDRGRRYGDLDGEPDVRFLFGSDPVLFLAARHEAHSLHTVELVTQSGRLRYERGGERIEWQGVQPHPRVAGYAKLDDAAEEIPTGMDRFQWHVADDLAAALDGRDYHLCSGQQALVSLERMHSLLSGLYT